MIKKWIIDWLLKGYLTKLLALLDGKKRYVSIILLLLILGQAVAVQVGQSGASSLLQVVIDVLSQSVTTPTPAQFGAWGFLLVALFDMLRKWLEEDLKK